MRAGHECSGQVDVWGLTLHSVSYFSGVLVQTKSALWVCHLWTSLDGGLVWFEAGHFGVWLLEPLESCSGTGQNQLLLMLGLGHLVVATK